MSRRFLPALALIAAATAFFFPVISGEGTFLALDILGDYLPWSTLEAFDGAENRMIIDPVLGFYPPHFFPAQVFFQQAIDAGTLPLWFDANFCGTPFILFSSPIPALLFGLLPLTAAHDLLLFFHLAGAGLLTFLFLRKLGLVPIAATLGGICWMFNGYVMVWFEFEHVPMLAALLPAALLAMELWSEKRSAAAFFAMAVSFALTLSVSYAHLIIYQMLFYGAYFAALLLRHAWKASFSRTRTLGVAAGTALAMILAMAVSANFFTSHLMLLKEGHRAPYGYDEIFERAGKLQPEHLSMLLFPDMFGNPVRKVTATPRPRLVRIYNNYNELCIYPGAFCLLLALAGAAHARRRRPAAFFLFAAIAILALAMGSVLFYPLWRFVPGLNLSTPTRVLYLFGFAVSVLAAVGADVLATREHLRPRAAAGLWILAAAASMALAAVVQTSAGVRWISSAEGWTAPDHLIAQLKPYYGLGAAVVGKPLLLTAASAGILFAVLAAGRQRHRTWLLAAGGLLLFFDLAGFGLFYNTVSPRHMAFPETPAIAFLKKDPGPYRIMTSPIFPSHGFVPFGIEDISGYGSFYPRRYGEFIYLSQYGAEAKIPERLSRRMLLNRAGSPLLDLINTKYLLTPASQQGLPGFSLVYDGEIRIFENERAFDRVFFVPGHRWAASKEEALAMLRTFSREDFKKTVILEAGESVPVPPASTGSDVSETDVKITIVSRQGNRMRIEVESRSDGFVVIGDNYHPGWEATIDGNKAPLWRANYVMRAVPVGKGRHDIEMLFRPKTATAGIYATLAGWPLLLICWVGALLREKRHRGGIGR